MLVGATLQHLALRLDAVIRLIGRLADYAETGGNPFALRAVADAWLVTFGDPGG